MTITFFPRNLIVLLLSSTLLLFGQAHAQSMPSVTPYLASASMQGQARLRVLVHIYDAALYVPAGFSAAQPYAKPMALSIMAGRGFRAESIMRQLAKELKRQELPEALLTQYEANIAKVMPAVEDGDVLTGVYTPKQGWSLWFKDKQLAQWSDDAFARSFFDIWLGPKASQTSVRDALLRQ